MFSFRSLLAPRRALRLFALLDDAGLCHAFRQSAQAPVGAGWVEVNEQPLAWLQQPLPASARCGQTGTPTRIGKALAA
jgi:hypothetical protein